MTQRAAETSSDYTHPRRPFLIRAYNTTARRRLDHSLQQLTADALMWQAARQEKWDDFGPDSFIEPLGVLLLAIQQEARLNPFGLFVTRQRLLNLLKNRLRVNRLLKAHPEIKEIELQPPILITGLQRTGTTLLHRLLSMDPAHRALMSYEALNPAPLHANPSIDQRKKLKLARTAQKALRYMAPDFFAIHPVEATAPEEDVLLLDYAMCSTVPESTLRVPGYASWIEQHDNAPAYEYMKTLLQVLSWCVPGRRWILKSPHHLEYLSEFLRVFPKATVVMSHRDPVYTLPSFCSMMAHGRGLFSDEVDVLEIGTHWLHKTARMLRIGHEVRRQHPVSQFVDIQYHQLMQHPIAQIREIYTCATLPFTTAMEQQIQTGLTRNQQHRYGIHRYDMASFGLSRERIVKAYGSYIPEFIEGIQNDPE